MKLSQANALQHARVLITRPGQRGTELAELLRARGAQAWHQPLLQILACGDPEQHAQAIQQLTAGDLMIAISRHAVQQAHRCLHESGQGWPTQCRYLAVGPATAQAWRAAGVSQVELPVSYNSEGLLAHPLCQTDSPARRVLILKGEAGRPLLEQQLRVRGWQLEALALYRREPVQCAPGSLLAKWQSWRINAIVITSIELLQQVHRTLSDAPELLHQCSIIVASQRIAQQAARDGFKRIQVADGAENQALLTAIAHKSQ